MKMKSIVALGVCLVISAFVPVTASAQLLPGEREAVIKAIPGVAAGIKWELIWAGFETADGIVGTPDGGVIFAQDHPEDQCGRKSGDSLRIRTGEFSEEPRTFQSGGCSQISPDLQRKLSRVL